MRAIDDLKALCESYNVELQEFPNGHYRLSNHGVSLDYWPMSKKRTVFKSGQRIEHIAPFDAVMLLKKDAKVSVDKKRVIKKAPPKNFKPVHTKGVCKHKDMRAIPWEGPEWLAESDKVRLEAKGFQDKAIELNAIADDMDDPEVVV